ncbi:MAG: hypothetical protein L0Y60_14605, partial [Beijerinckiaceae bacterium]|nr:hypothetical protein [Beijerinckiaceae bacterium]
DGGQPDSPPRVGQKLFWHGNYLIEFHLVRFCLKALTVTSARSAWLEGRSAAHPSRRLPEFDPGSWAP